jgi:hypothetical protein
MGRIAGILLLVAVLMVSTVSAVAQSSDAWIPGLASFVLPGLGQFINDEVDKAIIHFGVAVALNVGTYYISSFFRYSYLRYSLVGLLHLGWAMYSGLDAYNVAKRQGFTLGFVENGVALQMEF